MSLDWLKVALLYWERVRCIVPPAAEADLDSIELYRVLVSAKFIEETDPAPYTEIALKEFNDRIKPLMKAKQHKPSKTPEKSHRIDFNNEEFFAKYVARRLFAGDSVSGAQWDRFAAARKPLELHRSKFPSPFGHAISQLRKHGLEIQKQGDWIQLPAAVGSLYMMCLGSVMARSIGVPLVTVTCPP